jgi:hypothetical protein
VSGDRTPYGVELRVCQCKARTSRESSTTNSSDQPTTSCQAQQGRPSKLEQASGQCTSEASDIASVQQTTSISNQTSSIEFRTSIKSNLASNQTASIEEYNEMQTSYKAGVKQITSHSNPTSNKEIKRAQNQTESRKSDKKPSKNTTRCKQATKQASN